MYQIEKIGCKVDTIYLLIDILRTTKGEMRITRNDNSMSYFCSINKINQKCYFYEYNNGFNW